MSWFQKIFSLPANVKFGHSKNFKDFQEYKLIGEDEDYIGAARIWKRWDFDVAEKFYSGAFV